MKMGLRLGTHFLYQNMERKLTNGKLMDIIKGKWKENGKGGRL